MASTPTPVNQPSPGLWDKFAAHFKSANPVISAPTAPVATPVVAPATPVTATTPDADVAAAKENLLLSNIDRAYTNSVSSKHWYNPLKLFCLIKHYTWTVLTTKNDAKEFNKALTVMVEATAMRSLTAKEQLKVKTGPVAHSNAFLQSLDGARNLAAENAEIAFSKAFLERIKVLNIDPMDPKNAAAIRTHINAAEVAIKEKADVVAKKGLLSTSFMEKTGKDVAVMNLGLREVQIPTVLKHFKKNFFNNMVDAFVNKPATEITQESFTAHRDTVRAIFPNNFSKDIGAVLCQSLKEKRGTEFAELAKKYLTTAPAERTAVIDGIKAEMKTKLETEGTAVKAEFDVLYGTNGQPGKIHNYLETVVRPADNALLAAGNKLREEVQKAGLNNVSGHNSVDELLNANFTTQAILDAQNDVKAKRATFEAARKELNADLRRANEIARLSPELDVVVDAQGKSVAGKLHEIDVNLQQLDTLAANEAASRGNFYRALSV